MQSIGAALLQQQPRRLPQDHAEAGKQYVHLCLWGQLHWLTSSRLMPGGAPYWDIRSWREDMKQARSSSVIWSSISFSTIWEMSFTGAPSAVLHADAEQRSPHAIRLVCWRS